MKKIYIKLSSLIALVSMLIAQSSVASATILFQDDYFHDIDSESILIDANGSGGSDTSIQFGNDATASENGTITWDITNNTFNFDHTVDITGGLSATGAVDFSSASQTRLREDSDPAANAGCSNLGELIVDTTDNEVQICTATGAPGAATWSTIADGGDADTLDTLDSLQFLRSDTSDHFTSGTLTTDAGTTLDVDGNADFSGASQFIIRNGASNPATCTEGELFYNSTDNVLYTCTATNTWNSAGPQDFESVYSTDADNTLNTSNGNFTINAGTGTFAVSNTGGIIDFDADSFTLDLTGSFSIDGSGASNMTTDSGNLTLSTTTSGDVDVTSADDVNITSGDDINFNDAQLTSAIQLTNTATGFAPTLTGGGIIDNINEYTLTTAGHGASLVGTETGSFTNISPASDDVQAALEALDAAIGAVSSNNEILTFAPEYPDTVISKDGSNNRGKLESDYDSTNDKHYYKWTTRRSSLQDIDVRFKFVLPADFNSVGNFTFDYMTGTNTSSDNAVDVSVIDVTDGATCGSSNNNTTAGTWATGTITAATLNGGCAGLSAGDVMEVVFKLHDNSGGADYAEVGTVSLGYSNS